MLEVMTMAEPGREYEVISVSLPRDLVARVNEIVPQDTPEPDHPRPAVFLRRLRGPEAGRRGVQAVPTRAAPSREAEEERSLLGAAREISDAEVWAMLEREEARGRRATR